MGDYKTAFFAQVVAVSKMYFADGIVDVGTLLYVFFFQSVVNRSYLS